MSDLYTSRSKGGTYLKLGISKGAGVRQNERLVVYRNQSTGEVYHREIRDFEERMVQIGQTPSAIDSEGGHCD